MIIQQHFKKCIIFYSKLTTNITLKEIDSYAEMILNYSIDCFYKRLLILMGSPFFSLLQLINLGVSFFHKALFKTKIQYVFFDVR